MRLRSPRVCVGMCVCVCVRTHHVIGCLHQSKRLTITCVRTIQYTCSTIVLRLCTVFHLFLAVLEYCTKAGIYLVLDTLQYHKELCITLRLVNDGGYTVDDLLVIFMLIGPNRGMPREAHSRRYLN